MAEAVDNIIKALNETNSTDTESVLKRTPATTEGMLIAYTSLVIMALIPIFLGAFRSVQLHIKNKVSVIEVSIKYLVFLYFLYLIFNFS